MNPRMVPAAQKLCSRKRRNKWRAMKRKVKRHDALFRTIALHESVSRQILLMEPKDAFLLQYDTPNQRKQHITMLNSFARMQIFDPQNSSEIIMMNTPEGELVIPTHELIQTEKGWSLKRRQDFRLW